MFGRINTEYLTTVCALCFFVALLLLNTWITYKGTVFFACFFFNFKKIEFFIVYILYYVIIFLNFFNFFNIIHTFLFEPRGF